MAEADPKIRPRKSSPPDTDSRESIVYGSAYHLVKLYEVEIGYELRIIGERISAIARKLDISEVCELQDRYPSAIGSNEKASDILQCEDIDHLADTMYTMRELARLNWARMWLIDRRERIRMAARLQGTIEHSMGLIPTEEAWRQSSRAAEQSSGRIRHVAAEDDD